jgi:hypothetical protein
MVMIAMEGVMTMTDLIRRADALAYPIRIDHYDKEHGDLHFVLGIESVMEYIENLPSADAVSMEEHVKELNDLASAWKNKFINAEKRTEEIYDETMAKVANECKECKERLRNLRPSAEASQNLTKPNKELKGSDLISRADAMGAVQDHFNADGFKGYDDGQTMMDRIKTLPSANMKSWNGLYIKVYADDDPQDKAEKMYQICGDIAELAEVARCIQGYCTIPSAEAVQGEWIRVGHDIYECSLCHQNVMTKDIDCYSYCHRCGASMRNGFKSVGQAWNTEQRR